MFGCCISTATKAWWGVEEWWEAKDLSNSMCTRRLFLALKLMGMVAVPTGVCCWCAITSRSVREGCVRCSEYHLPSRVTCHRKIWDAGNLQRLICLQCLIWDCLSVWSKTTVFSNLTNVQKGKPTMGVAMRHNIFDSRNTLGCIIKRNIFGT